MTSTNRLRGRVTVRWLVCTPLLILLHLTAQAQLATLTEKITVRFKHTTALQVLQELDKQSTYAFLYTQTQLEKIKLASFQQENIPLGKALELLGAQAGLAWQVSGNTIAVRVSQPASITPAINARPGKVIGVIRNEKNETMPGVSIAVEGMERGFTSSVSGDYTLSLPPGTYTILVSFVGYKTKEVTGVVVAEGETADLSLVMEQADSRQLQTVVVTGGAKRESIKALLLAQKNNASMTNGISAEQIRVTPDNNTGQVLKRVSGITVQNDKFVTIRGVSDRYNNVLINGASLPSTEPNRRNFSFDIVPSQLVDNIVVNKTATPDLPSEFTGGMVQINTKDIPSEAFVSLTVGTGFNSASVNQALLSYKRDRKAAVGVIDPNRKWFGDGRLLDPVAYMNDRIKGNADAVNTVGGAIPNRWQIHSNSYQPQQNYQLSGGMSKRFKKSSIGFVVAGTYLNEQFREAGIANVTAQYEFESERYRYNTTIGGLFNAAYKSAGHRISIKNLYNKRYSNQFDWRYGESASLNWMARRTSEVTLDNHMWQTRIEGDHRITKGGIRFDWFGDYITLRREQPDSRFITAREQEGTVGRGMFVYNFSDRLLNLGGLFSSLLAEDRKNAGGNLWLPFKVAEQKQLLKVGYSWSERKADFDAANFRMLQGNSNYAESMQGAPLYMIVAQEAFAKGWVNYVPATVRGANSTGDKYTGIQTLKAGYAMLDLKPFSQLRVTGGVRYEDNRMNMSTWFYSYVTGVPSLDDTVYIEKDWLPSVNLVYSPAEKISIRLAYSKTMARPDFVERTPYLYYDFTELTEVYGQKSLRVSRIKNYDLRFEYYPSGDEILSASLFYKDFSDPVERFYHIGAAINRVEYQNLYKATAKGFELDFRKSLGFLDPASNWLSRLYLSGNYTYLRGDISYLVTQSPLTQQDTSYIADSKRPIQGLSPFIVNAGVNYQSKYWGFNVGYNKIGRRIVNGGTIDALIQYEHPRDVVDLQLNTRLFKQKVELKLNVADLLNQPYIIYSNTDTREGVGTAPGPNNDPKGTRFNEALDLPNYKVKRGTNFSVTATWRIL